MEDLVAWLRGVLDDDEKTAKAATSSEPGEPDRSWVVDSDTLGIGPRDSCGRDNCAWSIAYVRETDDDGDRLPAAANAAHIARHDPAAVLADVESKKAVLELCAERIGWPMYGHGGHRIGGEAEEIVRLLARAYRHRPGWRAEWE